MGHHRDGQSDPRQHRPLGIPNGLAIVDDCADNLGGDVMPGLVYYDLYDCGKLVGRYSGIELQKRFGWKCRPQVDKYSDMGILYQKRYLIVRVDMETWADEWNEARQRILRARR